ncbi:4056_t:CDS:2, partial [Gigaspora rosea]
LKSEKDFHLAYQLGMVYSGPVTYTQFYEIICKISEVNHYNSTLEENSLKVLRLVSILLVLKNVGGQFSDPISKYPLLLKDSSSSFDSGNTF